MSLSGKGNRPTHPPTGRTPELPGAEPATSVGPAADYRDAVTTSEFDAFLEERRAVGRAYVTGDAGPLAAISAERDPATFYPPNGGQVRGASEVLATNLRGAEQFRPGSETSFEILHHDASGDLGYLVGIQHATVQIQGRDEPVPMRLRLTEIFRREDGSWRLIHRHADPLAGPSEP